MQEYEINRYENIIQAKEDIIQEQQEEMQTKDNTAFVIVLLLLASLMFNGFFIVDKVLG